MTILANIDFGACHRNSFCARHIEIELQIFARRIFSICVYMYRCVCVCVEYMENALMEQRQRVFFFAFFVENCMVFHFELCAVAIFYRLNADADQYNNHRTHTF